MLMEGRQLTRAHSSMLDNTPDPDGVYVCIKSYVRDTVLQQPPELLLTPLLLGRMSRSVPGQVLPRRELGDSEIKSFLKLAQLCIKYGMPLAESALKEMVYQRVYSVVDLSWLGEQVGRMRGLRNLATGDHFSRTCQIQHGKCQCGWGDGATGSILGSRGSRGFRHFQCATGPG